MNINLHKLDLLKRRVFIIVVHYVRAFTKNHKPNTQLFSHSQNHQMPTITDPSELLKHYKDSNTNTGSNEDGDNQLGGVKLGASCGV